MKQITVKQARLLAGITQAKMAENMGIHAHTYRKIEGNPYKASIGQAQQICKITGLKFNQIFFDHESYLK